MNPYSGLKAGSKDPRALVRNVRGYHPTIQADQLQFYQQNQATQAGTVPLHEAVAKSSRSYANQSRIQTDYTIFRVVQFLGPIPVLIIPRNRNRSQFYISNLGEFTFFLSFETPIRAQVGGASQPLGFPVMPGKTFSETNGVISTNDIYISNFFDDAFIKVEALAYEGIPAIGAIAA